jgi:predicted DNA-binding transcriptional regulator AlpA
VLDPNVVSTEGETLASLEANHAMNQSNSSTLLGDALLDAIRQAVREELQVISTTAEQDRLLDANQAAAILGVSIDWLYRHAKKLPFTRKLCPKMLRFSSQGIQKYLSTRKSS